MTLKIAKEKVSLLTLALGALVATSLSAGTVTAAQGALAAPAEKRGFLAKRFSNVCTGALFSKANSSPALRSCVKNYPQDMRKLEETLKAKKAQKEGELKTIKEKIQTSLTQHKLGERHKAFGEGVKDLRKKHEQADPKSKILYRQENELASEVRHLTEQINAINAAFGNKNLPS